MKIDEKTWRLVYGIIERAPRCCAGCAKEQIIEELEDLLRHRRYVRPTKITTQKKVTL